MNKSFMVHSAIYLVNWTCYMPTLHYSGINCMAIAQVLDMSVVDYYMPA